MVSMGRDSCWKAHERLGWQRNELKGPDGSNGFSLFFRKEKTQIEQRMNGCEGNW